MKYTKPERLEIGRRVYDGELTKYEASHMFMAVVRCFDRGCSKINSL